MCVVLFIYLFIFFLGGGGGTLTIFLTRLHGFLFLTTMETKFQHVLPYFDPVLMATHIIMFGVHLSICWAPSIAILCF